MDRKFAILGDIHSNLDALNVVLDDCRAQGVTDFLCTGDVVGYNACPAECLKIVRELGCPALTVKDGKVFIDRNLCTGCALCDKVCPANAIGGEAHE